MQVRMHKPLQSYKKYCPIGFRKPVTFLVVVRAKLHSNLLIHLWTVHKFQRKCAE